MKFTSKGNVIIAYVAYSFMWYTIVSWLSGFILLLNAIPFSEVDFSEISMQWGPVFISQSLGTAVQLLVIFLVYRFHKNKAKEDFSREISYLCAGTVIIMYAMITTMWIPISLFDALVAVRRSYFNHGRDVVRLIMQILVLVIQFAMGMYFSRKSGFKIDRIED